MSWSELDRLPALALVAANLVPLAGVLFFGWDARNLLLLYWLENLVVGGYTLLRMLHASGLKAAGTGLFFSFHYGFFCAGHGMFVLAISSMGADFDDGWAVMDDANFGPLLPFVMLKGLLGWIAVHTPELLFIPLIGFVISHGVSTVMHHFIGGEDEGRAADDIMMDPYKRIFALHVAIIVGSFFVIQAGGGSAAPVLIVLVLLKTGIDLYQHRRAHRARAEAQPKLMRASRSTEESA